jgi:uncharacterized cupin superfamily protein
VKRANIYAAEFGSDDGDPSGYRSAVARVGELAGGRELTVNLFELPPGQSLCPYHYEYVEEWLVVLEGSVVVRVPDGEEELEPGDLICFPAGAAGAHKVTSRNDGTAHVLMFSSRRMPAVSVYPDSDKIGVWPGSAEDELMVLRADAHVDYWHGEP